MTLIFLLWRRTKLAAWGALLFFLLAYTVFNINFNAGFVLNTVLGLPAVWEGIPYLVLTSLVHSAFNLAIVQFTHRLTNVKVWFPLNLAVHIAAFFPVFLALVEIFAAGQGLSTSATRLDQLENFEIINGAFLLYNTGFFFLFRKRAVDPFFLRLIGRILVLNLIFIPLFTLEIVLNYHFLSHLRPISLDNAYYFIGSLIFILLLIRRVTEITKADEKNESRAAFQDLPLSKREIEIIHLVEAGFSNKQIAVKLFIEPSTVRNHLYRIFTRFEVHSRLELMRKLKDLGQTGQSPNESLPLI